MWHVSANSYVLALDQGTTSSRAIIFDQDGLPVRGSVTQLEHSQIFPHPGWVEHDPMEIWRNVRSAMTEALMRSDLTPTEISAIGITNQRETTVVWDRATGEPVYNAIVWQDVRTGDICDRLAADIDGGEERVREITGLPISTYFSGPKVRWILDNVPGARERAEAGELAFGTIDSWLVFRLTSTSSTSGGPAGSGNPEHICDVTNASRTMLMDLDTLDWSQELCAVLGIPVSMLPRIVPSSGDLATVAPGRIFAGTPVCGILGDQQAAMFGQTCFDAGEAKNTYGTGNFLLLSTGTERQRSAHGLITTVGYRLGDDKPRYALEGSIAVTGSLVQWLRDNLGLIRTSPEVEKLAESVEDNGDCYLVPAFSGLLAPRWRPDARGALVGLTRFNSAGHIARAALEATAYQTREVVEAMVADAGHAASEMRVDGGMVANELLMQFQADICDLEVVRPQITETTALGAAYAAGLAAGIWDSTDELRGLWHEDKRWTPAMEAERRERLWDRWNKAVERTFDWA